MRWSIKPKEPYDPYKEHLWFAWWPTQVSDDLVVWLETIWRREESGVSGGAVWYRWIYRLNEFGAAEWSARANCL